MTVVVAAIDIAAPPQEVFDLAMEPYRTPEWVTIALLVSDVQGDPHEKGFTMV